MKRKRLASIFAAALALLLILSGCGGSSASPAYDAASSAAPAGMKQMAMAAPAAPAPAPTIEAEMMDMEYDMAVAEEAGIAYTTASSEDAASRSVAPPDDRKIIKRSSMELETKEFDEAFAEILRLVAESGGYIENQSVNNQSLRDRGEYYERFADISARIPSERLTEVTNSIGGICNVTSRWEGVEDITDTYFDADARLSTMRIQEERLLELLSQAENIEDMITLEAKLSDVRYEIESLTARLRRMDSQVAYSYLSLYLREVVEYKPVNATPKTFSERIADAFERSGRRIVNFFENSVIFAIEDLPLMLINAIILIIVLFILVKLVRLFIRMVSGRPAGKPRAGKKKKNAAPPAQTTIPQPVKPAQPAQPAAPETEAPKSAEAAEASEAAKADENSDK